MSPKSSLVLVSIWSPSHPQTQSPITRVGYLVGVPGMFPSSSWSDNSPAHFLCPQSSWRCGGRGGHGKGRARLCLGRKFLCNSSAHFIGQNLSPAIPGCKEGLEAQSLAEGHVPSWKYITKKQRENACLEAISSDTSNFILCIVVFINIVIFIYTSGVTEQLHLRLPSVRFPEFNNWWGRAIIVLWLKHLFQT